MLIVTIGVILFTLFFCFIIGLMTYTMFVKKATPQIYYTPVDSITAQPHVNKDKEKKGF
ncbi:DUF3951 domain-containing protein [Bacillus sp. DX1.1]|uniref:DUF3951 domain-containing protein n=1 Tax=unclassified Bacillus (in: firmicutes) TaxID=185979 RepID=UPI0025713132|nr:MULTISPECIES: DUF3951 domain-containing protein [unclassified Bacillus (in: firmicutes)]MDM5154267.1 DUF3951 domain-containing protein [Bacillus sp. DX1.1]WJE83185.1 DUF3951 domain-containing protein [Bacillus sp. DX3.1]